MNELTLQARSVPKAKRGEFLEGLKETEVHKHLAKLFEAMQPDYRVAITHGADELGKDLVLVRSDLVSPDVMAVVVKRGNIKGNTLGDVDEVRDQAIEFLNAGETRRAGEIESQIKQALVHEADIGTSFSELPVTKVIVVLVGAASKQARQRLRAERPNAVTVRDIDWLIDNFTKYYPQVFFRGSTVAYLQQELRRLEKSHLLEKGGKPLTDYYVEPLVSRRRLPLDASEDELAIVLRDRKIRVSSLRKVIEKKERLLLVGDPGSGKSTAVAKLSIDMLLEQTRELVASPEAAQIAIPLSLRAMDLLEVAGGDDLLAAHLPLEVAQQVRVSVIMIDGLDEVPGTSRAALLQKAADIGQELECGVLVTSRNVGAVTSTPQGYEKYELLPFEINQAVKLVGNILETKAALPTLRQGIQRLAHQLPMNPLSLMLLVEIVEERQEVPASLVELYERFTDIALGRYDREKGIAVVFEHVIKKRFLGRLAYELFFEVESLAAGRKAFDDFVRSYAEEYGWDPTVLDDFVKEIERAGIIELGDEVVFRHRSFLEYFVASHIHDNRMELHDVTGKIASIYYDELWSDVAFYFVGLSREMPSALLDALIKFDSGEGRGSYERLLLGRLLQAGWYSPTRIKRAGIEAAIKSWRPVANRVHAFSERSGLPLPRTMGDFAATMLSDMSFGSMVLKKEVRQVIEGLLEQDVNDPLVIVSLYGAVSRHLTAEEDERLAERVQESLTNLPPGDEARGVLMMLIASRGRPQIAKALSRRLRVLRRDAPKEVKALLPPRMKKVRERKQRKK